MNLEHVCRGCGSRTLSPLRGFDSLVKITSDCRPTKTTSGLGECGECGLSQKLMSPSSQAEIDKIYREYVTYKNNLEPIVFASDVDKSRSKLIFSEINRRFGLRKAGTLVDLGCGDGAFLRAFTKKRPNWDVYGYDLNGNRKNEIDSICGSGSFLTGSLENLPDRIDLVTLNYVAEHLLDVKSVLRSLAPKMSSTGLVSIVVPNLERNPYDLVVADHLSHYSPESIYSQVRSLMKIEVCAEFLGKELFVLGQLRAKDSEPTSSTTVRYRGLTQKSIEHLLRIRAMARDLMKEYRQFGILGTAIAGTWLTCELNCPETFFVEEDERKQGGKHLQRSVIAPSDASSDACIFLPFIRSAAVTIRKRISIQTPAVVVDPWSD